MLHAVYRLCIRHTRQGITEVRIDAHDESGTVTTVCQACTAPYVWISDKLQGKIDDRLACLCFLRCFLHRGQRIITGLIVFRLDLKICLRQIIFTSGFHLLCCRTAGHQITLLYKSSHIAGLYKDPVFLFVSQQVTQPVLFQRTGHTRTVFALLVNVPAAARPVRNPCLPELPAPSYGCTYRRCFPCVPQ